MARNESPGVDPKEDKHVRNYYLLKHPYRNRPTSESSNSCMFVLVNVTPHITVLLLNDALQPILVKSSWQ